MKTNASSLFSHLNHREQSVNLQRRTFIVPKTSCTVSAPSGDGTDVGSIPVYVVRRGTSWYAVHGYALSSSTWAKHSLNFGRAPDFSGDRVCTPLLVPWSDGGVCRLLYDVHQTLSLCSLYSDSPLSSRPQPRESDGDVTPRKDTREDFGLSFLRSGHRVLQGVFFCVVAKCATGLWWLWWPRVRATWRFNTTTLRVGSPWWSSGGTT